MGCGCNKKINNASPQNADVTITVTEKDGKKIICTQQAGKVNCVESK